MALSPEVFALMKQANKKYGPGTMITAGEMRVAAPFTTGSLPLDIILGGGLPANQWTEIIGFESSGKTSVVHKAIAANQRRDPDFTTLWVAAEGYDKPWAEQLGVDTNRVIVHATSAMEEAYQVMLDFADSRSVDAIVLDSYPALVPDEETEKQMDELSVALGARLTGKFFRKAGKATARSHVEDERPMMGVIINQWREKIGGFSPQGTPKTTPGGLAKNFAFYVRLEITRAEYLDEATPGKGKARCGQVIKFRTVKNKQHAPQKVAETHFCFADSPSRGVLAGEYDTVRDLMTWGVYYDVIKRRGRYFDFADRTWDLKDAIIDSLREELDLRDEVAAAVLTAAFHPEPQQVAA
ncbi:hypothetical protein ACFWAP_00440 [Streptomyces goshikiensis]|uniref:hypothetical protein n=1 Tax=Streptomyces goshikiensis TaxID=1942 RepID=UPI0036490FD2